MKLDRNELLAAKNPLLDVLKIMLENRIESWSTEGHIEEDYVEYKIRNGLFTYHVNKEKRPFSLSSQRFCAEQSWGPEGQSAYYDAIDLALEVIGKGVDLEAQDEAGNTALMLACAVGEPRLLKPLLAGTKNIHQENHAGETALHLIARSGREDGAKLFLKKEYLPDVNRTDRAGWTALHHLVHSGDALAVFNLLQKKKIDLKRVSTEEKYGFPVGTTALDIAKATSRQEILPLLDTDKTTFSPAEIREAALNGKLSVVEKYLKAGGDVELIDPEDSASILIDVARNSNALDTTADMVRLLLKYGANINATQNGGFNALMICVNSLYNKGPRIPAFDGEYREHVKIAKLLIDGGIDLAQTKKGSMQKVLRDAAEISPEITKMILDKLRESGQLEVELNYQDSDGFTAMHTAVRSGNLETIRCLVNAGAQINIAEDYGFIPLHEAIIGGNYENVKYLIGQGADVTHRITRADGAYDAGDDAKAIASKSRNKEILNLF